MPQFRSNVNHGSLQAGEVVEIDEAEVSAWAGEIELGFLQPVGPDALIAVANLNLEDDADE